MIEAAETTAFPSFLITHTILIISFFHTMARTTSALVVNSAGAKPELTTITVDSLQEDEVLVQMHATGVCHTDLSCMAGHLPVQFPNVFGHEGMVLVVQLIDYGAPEVISF